MEVNTTNFAASSLFVNISQQEKNSSVQPAIVQEVNQVERPVNEIRRDGETTQLEQGNVINIEV